MKTVHMHPTTLDYIKTKVLDGQRPPVPTTISNNGVHFLGVDIILCEYLEPTINETEEWIFPKHRFYSYGPEDLEWCKYAGIGRPGRGFKLGQIIEMNSDFSVFANYNDNRRIITFDPFAPKRYTVLD